MSPIKATNIMCIPHFQRIGRLVVRRAFVGALQVRPIVSFRLSWSEFFFEFKLSVIIKLDFVFTPFHLLFIRMHPFSFSYGKQPYYGHTNSQVIINQVQFTFSLPSLSVSIRGSTFILQLTSKSISLCLKRFLNTMSSWSSTN